MSTREELLDIAGILETAANDAELDEEKIQEQRESVNEMMQESQQDDIRLSLDDWLRGQPILSHFDIEKKHAQEYGLSLSDSRKQLKSSFSKYEVEGKDIPSLVKELKYYRRTLKGDRKKEFSESIDNMIKGYADHLDKCVDEIYWIKKYKPLIRDMVCSESQLFSISKIEDEDTRREMVDTLCKYWELKIQKESLGYGSEYANIHKKMMATKKEFKALVKNQNTLLKSWSVKDEVGKELLQMVCMEQGISVKQIHDKLPKNLQKHTSPAIISKIAKTKNVTNLDGALYKFSDEIKKDIYAYTAAFIDSDGYITMDKSYNPRVGLVATGDRGKAFMMEMHKSLGVGRLHLDQKSPQDTRPVNRLNFYSMDDVKELLTKCLPHFKMKKANAEILLELIRMKKSHKKEEWYQERRDELFKLMKYENHKDHVGYDFTQYDIDIDTVAKLHDNSKMNEMDRIEGMIV